MWLDAALAYLHFIAIFMLFAFLTVQAWWPGATGDPAVRLLGRRHLVRRLGLRGTGHRVPAGGVRGQEGISTSAAGRSM